MAERLAREFYARPAVEVARALLGKVLVHALPGGRRAGRIVETEAYVGPDDAASHAFGRVIAGPGRKAGRAHRMWGPPGTAYVYIIYGVWPCLNVVCDREGFPAAVLLRALAPLAGVHGSASGPGKLCQAMGVDKSHDGADLVAGHLYVEDRGGVPPEVLAGPRIGVDYAGEWAARPLRFCVAGAAAVSRPRPAGWPRR